MVFKSFSAKSSNTGRSVDVVGFFDYFGTEQRVVCKFTDGPFNNIGPAVRTKSFRPLPSQIQELERLAEQTVNHLDKIRQRQILEHQAREAAKERVEHIKQPMLDALKKLSDSAPIIVDVQEEHQDYYDFFIKAILLSEEIPISICYLRMEIYDDLITDQTLSSWLNKEEVTFGREYFEHSNFEVLRDRAKSIVNDVFNTIFLDSHFENIKDQFFVVDGIKQKTFEYSGYSYTVMDIYECITGLRNL